VEVTFYIQAYDEQNPRFTVGGWTATDPIIRITIQEEKPVASTILMVTAIDPPTNLPITRFSVIPPFPSAVSMDSSGNIVVSNRIDYESMEQKV
jgi:hypothetical protein